MKQKKFKKATSKNGKVYVNHTKNTIIMKFRPSPWEILKMALGFPGWSGMPIQSEAEKKIDLRVIRTAFIKEEDD